jgi:hypothetical protein
MSLELTNSVCYNIDQAAWAHVCLSTARTSNCFTDRRTGVSLCWRNALDFKSMTIKFKSNLLTE